MKKKIYVNINKHIVGANKKHGTNHAPIRISVGKSGKPKYRHKYRIPFPATVIYDPKHPLPCGAQVWIEFEEATI